MRAGEGDAGVGAEQLLDDGQPLVEVPLPAAVRLGDTARDEPGIPAGLQDRPRVRVLPGPVLLPEDGVDPLGGKGPGLPLDRAGVLGDDVLGERVE